MPFLSCILPVVTFLCQPVLGAVDTHIGNQARRFLDFLTNFLTNWAGGRLGDRANAAEEVPESASEVVGAEETLSEIRNPAEEVPESASELVGAEETLSEIQNHLKDESVGIIGIYGMGGVGKTTILQRINNEFFFESGSGFDLVVWVTVSQTVNIPEIQKRIADRMGLPLSDSSSTEENAGVLFRALSDKRFLVLLDDIWEAVDLQVKIGIPNPKGRRRHSKIAFTTRSLRVCVNMGADKRVRVKPLDEAASRKLFCSNLWGEEEIRTNPAIWGVAQQVVDKCGGLPLAIVTVARAMATSVDIQDWEYAVKALDRCAERLDGMDQVLGCLKFSYDHLKKDNMRSALLFCAMYPEDEEIRISDLLDFWVAEGLVDDENEGGEGRMDDARGQAGQALVNKLRDACLLEAGRWSSTVRMHDAVRDMALWINREEYDKADGFLVYRGSRSANTVTRTKGREHIKRIWVRPLVELEEEEEEMFNPDEILSCSSNRTLLFTNVRGLGPSILRGVAASMCRSTLRVLDLSRCRGLEELPGEVGMMTELRYLNLSGTHIRSLPRELGNLVKLRQLVLNFMSSLREIPREAVAGLGSLQVLDMLNTEYDWARGGSGEEDGTGRQLLEVGDLEAHLPRLEELNIKLGTRGALERLLRSRKLCKCTRRLTVEREGDRSILGVLKRHIQSLSVLKRHRQSLSVLKRHIRQSKDPLYGEGDSLLWRVFSSMGGSLKRLELHGDDLFHPWVGGLRIDLDQLPLLEDLQLLYFRSKRMTEVVLVGANNNNNPRSGNKMNVRLSSFSMWHCVGWKVLKLEGTFPCLQTLSLYDCSAVEELTLDDDGTAVAGIGEEGTQDDDAGLLYSHFPILGEISLDDMPALKSMGRRQPLRLPALRSITAKRCPELRRIPLDAAGVPKLESIVGPQEWWDSLECVDSGGHDTKPLFEKLFVSRN